MDAKDPGTLLGRGSELETLGNLEAVKHVAFFKSCPTHFSHIYSKRSGLRSALSLPIPSGLLAKAGSGEAGPEMVWVG